MSLAINHFYRFGEFTVDREQKILLRNGSPVPLAPKIFDTLLILVDNSGRIVEKEELMQRLWPDTFVEESNLTFNIQQLRKALGDNARHPRFIETVARRGYRFIAEVNGNAATTIATETGPIGASVGLSSAARRRIYWPITALVVAIVGVITIFWWSAHRRSSASASSSAPILSARFKSEKFVTEGSDNAVITPDGKYVAYTSETGGKVSIWLRQLETSENIQIVPPTDEKYLGLTISHDGNSLYFVRDDPNDTSPGTLYRVMTFGGIPVKIVENTEGAISLSPDDKQLSFIRANQRDDDFRSLHVIDADGKNERTLLSRPRPFRLVGAQFSPDGKSIAFASGQSWNGGSDFRLMRIDLASGTESQIASRTFFNIHNLKWLPDGDGLLLTARDDLYGRQRIWHVSIATREARVLTKDATDYHSLSLDKAADKMIATHGSSTFHLYLARIDELNNPKNLAAAMSGVTFAPEGRIVYSGDGDIWTINQDGGEQRQLTNNSFGDFYPRVSPDGRYIFFTSNRSGANQVWRLNADGTNQVQLTKREGGYPKFVTPDGKWVYFLSGLYGSLWRVPADGGEENQVLEGVIYESALSPDGKLVAYLFRDKRNVNQIKLAVMTLVDQRLLKTFSFADKTPSKVNLAWASDGKSLYYVTTDGGKNSVWQQSLDDENPRLTGDLGSEEIGGFAVSPNGSSFAFIRGGWIVGAVLIEGLR